MRVAALIIGLCLTVILGLQSCALSVGGSMVKDQAIAGGGGVGLFVALMFVLGSAFVLGYPRLSASIFAFAGLIGLISAGPSGFSDLRIWGFVAFALAAISFFGSRELRRRNAGNGPAV